MNSQNIWRRIVDTDFCWMFRPKLSSFLRATSMNGSYIPIFLLDEEWSLIFGIKLIDKEDKFDSKLSSIYIFSLMNGSDFDAS